MSTTFSDWLLREMESRGLSQSQLARAADLSQAAIAHVLAGDRRPGERLCKGIAKAFGVPLEEVYARAGMLPAKREADIDADRLLDEIMSLPPEDRVVIRDMMQIMVRRAKGRVAKRGGLDAKEKTG